MRTSHRLIPVLLGSALIACGGDLTLPDNTSPAALEVWSGNGQEGTVRTKLDDPLVVRLTDGSARPLEGLAIVFEFTSDVPGAEVSPEQATTDTSGRASAEVRLGTSTGDLQVRARLATAASVNATFIVTAVERDKERDKRGKGGGDDDEDDD
ncbi:MAG TPA: hypothetical protein VNO19_05400 [Gemmatimonadales bacterium]|nr:hypothetical protein [Gemmatimonadales bacterium]